MSMNKVQSRNNIKREREKEGEWTRAMCMGSEYNDIKWDMDVACSITYSSNIQHKIQ